MASPPLNSSVRPLVIVLHQGSVPNHQHKRTMQMTIDDLISKINADNCSLIQVERTNVRTGNTDGSGNHSILTLRMGAQEIVFDNSTGVWSSKA